MEKVKKLEVYEKALIIVDMVNGFVEEGVLHDKKISRIIPRQLELIQKNHQQQGLTIFIKDSHTERSTEFKRFNNTKHCLTGSKESKVVDDLKEWESAPDTISIMKNSTSFMESPDFRQTVEQLTSLKAIDIVGCCTDICIVNGAIALANYFDQWNKDIPITVHEDAIATYDEENRSNYVGAAKLLMAQQGIQLVKKRQFF